MKAQSSSQTPDQMADLGTSERRSASIHLLSSSARVGPRRSVVQGLRVLSTPRNETVELLADIEGLPVLVRVLLKDIPTEMQADFASKGTDIHSQLSSTLEKMVDRMRGSSLRSAAPSNRSFPIPTQPNETVLRVGPLELDLLDRTAKRGDRQIDLRPREFQLLKYMMQRSDQLLTRATLFKEVWDYKFVPESNLVDVHMGRLRRKVDGANELPMISNVRGVGFILGGASLSQDSQTRPAETDDSAAVGGFRGRRTKYCNDIDNASRNVASPARVRQ
jgi:DNA-binding winged helix-turn-helix (wHTH) protein